LNVVGILCFFIVVTLQHEYTVIRLYCSMAIYFIVGLKIAFCIFFPLSLKSLFQSFANHVR
jgi:hypothetical protein